MGRSRNWNRAQTRPRPASPADVLSGFAVMETTGLRLAAELRGFAQHDLADMLCVVIEQLRPIHSSAVGRLQDADLLPTGSGDV